MPGPGIFVRAEALLLALWPLWAGCGSAAYEPPEIPSPVRLATARIQPIARVVQAQGLVLRRGGGLVIEVGASAAESPLLHAGLSAEASDLQNGASWNCRLTEVLEHASLETGASVAWLEPLSGSGSLREGDFVSARILASWMPRGLVVPSSAVLIHAGKSVVVLALPGADGALKYQGVEVAVGMDSGEFTQVLTGLKDGDRVVVEGGTGFLAPEFKSHPTD